MDILQGPNGWRYDKRSRVAIAPDGTKYPWKGKSDPTDDDLDEVIRSHKLDFNKIASRALDSFTRKGPMSSLEGMPQGGPYSRQAKLKYSEGPDGIVTEVNGKKPPKATHKYIPTGGGSAGPVDSQIAGSGNIPFLDDIVQAVVNARESVMDFGGKMGQSAGLRLENFGNSLLGKSGLKPELKLEETGRLAGEMASDPLNYLGTGLLNKASKTLSKAKLPKRAAKGSTVKPPEPAATAGPSTNFTPKEAAPVTQTTPKPVKPPETPVKRQETSNATGLANQVQKREAEILGEIEPMKGRSAREWQQVGQSKVKEIEEKTGASFDFDSLAEKVASGDVHFNADTAAMLLEGKARMMKDLNAKAERMNQARGTKGFDEAFSEYEKARERLITFSQNVQVGKGAWSDVGRALQAGTDINEGSFASVIAEADRIKPVKPKDIEEFDKLTREVAARDERISALEKELAEARASVQIKGKRAARTYDREAIIAEIDSLAKEWEMVGSSKGVGKNRQRGAVSITWDDIKTVPERLNLATRIVSAHLKLGVASLEELVVSVQTTFREKLGLEVDRQTVIDMAAHSQPKTRTEIQKQIASLRAQAKRESSTGKAQRAKELLGQIEDLKMQLETGNFRIPTSKEVLVDRKLSDLKAERDIWAGRVRSALRERSRTTGDKIIRGGASIIRGTQLGSDIGIVTRQGLFAWSRPLTAIKSLGKAAKNAFSEKNFAKWQRGLDEREIGGQKMALIDKKAGLQRTNTLTAPEELSFSRLLKKVPIIGESLGGSLERFQHTFINQVRADLFDYAYKRGYSADELAERARFINNSTGRGNFKHVPKTLEVILTSPRYEASRWAMIGEAVRNPVKALSGNRGAIANVQDMAVTAGEIYALYKMAELGGYEVDFNPTSSDFLKMRKGDEVWDPSAGLAPRLRDAVRMVAYGLDPSHQKNLPQVFGDMAVRPLSPAVRLGWEGASYLNQKLSGKKNDEIRSAFTGFESDIPEEGWMTMAPIIMQSVKKAYSEDGLGMAVWTGAREFVGQSVNRYPKPSEAPNKSRKPKKKKAR